MHVIKKYISKLTRGGGLDKNEIENIFSFILRQSICISQMSAILTLLSHKENEVHELEAALDVMYQKWGQKEFKNKRVFSMLSTGSCNEHLDNISVQIGLIIGSLGVGVVDFAAKSHLNNNSANLLENLGYDQQISFEQALQIFEQTNYFFIEERRNFKIPADYYLLKEDLGFVNFFEVVKSLYEPIKSSHRFLGLDDKKYRDVIVQLFLDSKKENAWIINNKDAIDKISLSSVNYITSVSNGMVNEFIIDPQDYFTCRDMEYKNFKEMMDSFYYKNPSPYLLINLAACLAIIDNQSSFDKVYLEKAEEMVKDGVHIKKCQEIIGCNSYAKSTSFSKA